MKIELVQKLENLVAWIGKKGKLIKKHYDGKRFPPCEKGQIFWCDLGTNVGVEIDKNRPVIIWQNPKINNYHSVVVIPLTHTINSEHEKKRQFVILNENEDLEIGNLGGKLSRALTDQIRTVSRLRIKGQNFAILNKNALLKIERAICFTLDIKNITPSETQGGEPNEANLAANS